MKAIELLKEARKKFNTGIRSSEIAECIGQALAELAPKEPCKKCEERRQCGVGEPCPDHQQAEPEKGKLRLCEGKDGFDKIRPGVCGRFCDLWLSEKCLRQESLPESVEDWGDKEYSELLMEICKKQAEPGELGEFTKKVRKAWPSINQNNGWWEKQLSKACDLIDSQQAELAASNKALMNHREALSVFARLRILYESSPCMKTEPVMSATKLMMKQCEEGLRIAQQNRQQEYCKELKAELTAKDKIIQLVYDYLTRDPVVVKKKWGVCGMKAQELIIEKIEKLKGGAG